MIMLWLLSQMLGSALPALPVVAEPETLPCRAWEKTQSVNKAYDAGCRSPLAYDGELAEVAVARWSEFDILTQAAFSYDCAPSFLSRKVDSPRAPPFGEGRFLAPKNEVTALTKFYPENAGFAGATERTFLMPGQTLDRYGGSGYSRFFSPQGTADWARSLPPGTAGQPLRTFEVMKPFEVQSGTVAPWFNQPGGGLQYRTPVKLEILLKRGILKKVTP